MVTLNPAYGAKELKRALNHVGASTLILVPSLRSSDYLASLHELLPSLSGSATAGGDKTVLNDENIPSLKRLVLVDNITQRPRGWESNSVLAAKNRSFDDVMASVNGRATDYRDLLVKASSTGSENVESVTNQDVINL